MARTLLSINNYFYARGGAEVVFLRHNGIFEDAGWAVAVFCMQHPRNRHSRWSGEFVEEIEFGSEGYGVIDKVSKGLKAVYSLEARAKVGRLIDRIEPDVCHVHNVYHHISPSVLSVVRNRGVPLVMTLHDLKIACPAYSMLTHDGVCERCRDGGLYRVATNRCMKGSPALSLLVMVESYLHRFLGSYTENVDKFIVPSRFYLEKLCEWGFDRARFAYVPNFVQVEDFRPRYEPGSRFTYFGRLSPEKGVATLIRACADAGVGLDVVGAGPIEDELHELAAALEADVRFHGYQSGDALYDRIAAARAVVVPSEWYENAPLSVLEAGALGKPVIAADIGGLPELVVDGESGWIFPSGSVEALSACLQRVAQMPDGAVEGIGSAARAGVAEHFSPHAYLTRIRGVYEELGVVWH